MPSTLTWIDHDAQARERSLRILSLFREHESRDELGIGSIRDAIADRLFPGTSTIQTRLRYMLFIPWIYTHLEARKVRAATFAAKAKELELKLVEPLLATEDNSGVFGRMAGKELKRLPSIIYWAGLRAWGILRFEGSQDQYHRAIDSLYEQRAQHQKTDDQEWLPDGRADTWHPKLPSPPEHFPNSADFTLLREEAEFLLDRIASQCRDSLLAWLALEGAWADCAFPWEHPNVAAFPEAMQVLLKQARLFSIIHHGAALLYNLQLSEQAEKDEWVDDYHTGLMDWAQALPWSELAAWKVSELWAQVVDQGHTITAATQAFIEAWIGLLLAHRHQIGDIALARQLIRQREIPLKQGRSRFTNRTALGQWGGASGLARLDYRWGTANRLLWDLQQGLEG